jgi:hypothetical protein
MTMVTLIRPRQLIPNDFRFEPKDGLLLGMSGEFIRTVVAVAAGISQVEQ